MRRAALITGTAVLAGAWLGPLADLSSRSFAAHMTMHMAVVAVAAPLIAAGIVGGRLDPVRAAPAYFAAIPASLLELVVVWAWHAPALHQAARLHTGMLVAEQASFLAAGLFFWVSIFGGDPAERAERSGVGVVALLLTFAHMTLLGALLALTPRPLYVHAGAHPGPHPLADQQLGGTIMLIVGSLVYIGAGLYLSRGLLRGVQRQEVSR